MSTIKAFVIQPDDNRATEVDLPVETQLAALQATVGGYIEVVTSSDGNVSFWCNDEGKNDGLPLNGLATAYWWAVCPEAVDQDVLVGPVVVTGGADADGGTLPIPEDMAKLMLNTYVPEEDE